MLLYTTKHPVGHKNKRSLALKELHLYTDPYYCFLRYRSNCTWPNMLVRNQYITDECRGCRLSSPSSISYICILQSLLELSNDGTPKAEEQWWKGSRRWCRFFDINNKESLHRQPNGQTYLKIHQGWSFVQHQWQVHLALVPLPV